MRYNEKREHWPLLKSKSASPETAPAFVTNEKNDTIEAQARALEPKGLLTKMRGVMNPGSSSAKRGSRDTSSGEESSIGGLPNNDDPEKTRMKVRRVNSSE